MLRDLMIYVKGQQELSRHYGFFQLLNNDWILPGWCFVTGEWLHVIQTLLQRWHNGQWSVLKSLILIWGTRISLSYVVLSVLYKAKKNESCRGHFCPTHCINPFKISLNFFNRLLALQESEKMQFWTILTRNKVHSTQGLKWIYRSYAKWLETMPVAILFNSVMMNVKFPLWQSACNMCGGETLTQRVQ